MDSGFKRLKGFADLFGEQLGIFTKMEAAARIVFARYGFEELRTPILEQTSLFQRSIGSETDVVQKEMFTFQDSKDRSMTLRPEATAGVLRACIEENLVRQGAIGKLFTIGPMFRHERPQKGRMRQFHQINCECLGSDSPYVDAELICMLMNFLHDLDISGLVLKINSLGCKECRPRYMEILKEYLRGLKSEDLCEDCVRRISTNPLRVLDCKQEKCKNLTCGAPSLRDNLCPECKAHFEEVLSLLHDQGLNPQLDDRLVRGLDYYMRTTFEVVSDNIGAQTAVAGGGRYDGLVEQLGGQDMPGIGFACGMERLGLLMRSQESQKPDFYFITPDSGLRATAFMLVQQLRKAGYSGEMNYQDAGFKSLMRQAGKSGARYCLILGPDEAERQEVAIKNMSDGSQVSVSQQNLINFFAS